MFTWFYKKTEDVILEGCNEVPTWANGLIRYFDIFHDRALGSYLRFRNPEKILGGEDICVSPTCGSAV